MFYDNVKEICELRGTTISTVLHEIGRASGNTGSWKIGKYPRIDIIMELAEHLQVTTDDLLYGPGKSPFHEKSLSHAIDPEWIEIIDHIPSDRQKLCKDFLRTHMVLPDKYEDKKNA